MKLKAKHLKPFWNKKNILLVSLILVFSLSAGVALTWLSQQKGLTEYPFEGAKVDCKVVEEFDGTTKSNVKIQNLGNVAAYMRATYTVSWVKDGTEGTTSVIYPQEPRLGVDYTVTYGSGWVLSNDGYFYYNAVVAPQGETNPFIVSLVDKHTAPEGFHLQVTVLPEGVQAEGSGEKAYQAAFGNTKNLVQNRPAPYQNVLDTEVMLLSMNIRIAGGQYSDGTYAADTLGGEWTKRRGSLAQYFRGSQRDIICLQEVGMDQHDWLKSQVNTGERPKDYGFAYWSYDDSQRWYRGLLTMYDVNKYDYLDYELVYFSDDGTRKLTYDDGTTNAGGEKPYHYRGALITRFRDKAKGVIIAVCNVQADYPVDSMVGQYDCTTLEKIDQLRERDINRALTRLYAQNADFHVMAGDFTADAYRNPNWYNNVNNQMQDVLHGETKKTITDWDDRGYLVYQREGPKASDVNGPVDFIFVDKDAQVYHDAENTRVHDVGFNYGEDLYSRHYAVFTKVIFK